MIAVDDAHLPAGQAGRCAQGRDDRLQALGAALDQGPQQGRLGTPDLVVQRRQRYGQVVHLARGGMQRRAQSQGNQRHQLDHRGKQQLAWILALPVSLEHFVDPGGRHCPFQRQTCHDAGRCLPLEARQNCTPDRKSVV